MPARVSAAVTSSGVAIFVPMISGAASSAHSENWDSSSVWVMPPSPIVSMSGSLKPPGLAYWAYWSTSLTMETMLA